AVAKPSRRPCVAQLVRTQLSEPGLFASSPYDLRDPTVRHRTADAEPERVRRCVGVTGAHSEVAIEREQSLRAYRDVAVATTLAMEPQALALAVNVVDFETRDLSPASASVDQHAQQGTVAHVVEGSARTSAEQPTEVVIADDWHRTLVDRWWL